MAITNISSKGQVTLPVEMRRRLKLAPNDPVTIEKVGDAIVIKRATDFFELKGFLGKALPGALEKKRMQVWVSRHLRNSK
jgi:AbrB family looped-hinge helix DNA binding protein